MIRFFQERRSLVVSDSNCECAAAIGLSQAGDREGRRTAGSDRNDNVTGIDPVLSDRRTPSSILSSAPSIERVRAFGPPAITNNSRSSGQLNVGISSAPSWTARRPDVPAPT